MSKDKSNKTKEEFSVETEELETEDAVGSTEEEFTEESKVEQLEQEVQVQKDKYLRLFADFDNFRKRTAKERLDLLDTAGKDIIVSVLPALDDFERAIAAAETAEDVASVKEGMMLIKNKLFGILEQRGLKPMDCVGEPFDPEMQMAITEIPAPSEDLKGKIIDQVEKGYTLNEKIIRYAKVVVGK